MYLYLLGMEYKYKDREQEYHREYNKKLYADPEKRKQKIARNTLLAKASLEHLREYIRNWKLEHPCPCGEDDPICLDFHHLHNKNACIAHLVRRKNRLETIQAEIAKCVVLCKNCHAKETARLQNAKQKAKDI